MALSHEVDKIKFSGISHFISDSKFMYVNYVVLFLLFAHRYIVHEAIEDTAIANN